MIRRFILALGMLLGLESSVAHAEADGPDYFRVVGVAPNDVLNIRNAPSASAQKIGAIPPDADGVQNLGCEGGLSFAEWEVAIPAEREAAARNRWCQISYQGVVGWVAGRFLAEGSYPKTTDLWAVKGVAGDDVLNVRGAPSGQAPIIGALSPYETGITNLGCLTPSGSTTEWCRIQVYDIDGWVAGRFIEPQS